MGLTSVFKSFGHAIAAGAKYFAEGVKYAVLGAAKAEQSLPIAEDIISLIAGPQAKAIADTAYHIFGDVAHALEPLAADALAEVSAKGLNLQLDLQVLQDVKTFAELIKKILAAKGTPAPAA